MKPTLDSLEENLGSFKGLHFCISIWYFHALNSRYRLLRIVSLDIDNVHQKKLYVILNEWICMEMKLCSMMAHSGLIQQKAFYEYFSSTHDIEVLSTK